MLEGLWQPVHGPVTPEWKPAPGAPSQFVNPAVTEGWWHVEQSVPANVAPDMMDEPAMECGFAAWQVMHPDDTAACPVAPFHEPLL